MERIVVGVSGASGIILAYKAVLTLIEAGYEVHLVISKAAFVTAAYEMGTTLGSMRGFLNLFPDSHRHLIKHYKVGDMTAAIASGSYRVKAMLVIPCSMATLAAIATGFSDNLLRRAADVALKERWPLVIVPREAPLTEIHLQHMLTLTRMGATIVPPAPAWYTKPKSVDDIENFIVGKTLDVLRIPHALFPRWESTSV